MARSWRMAVVACAAGCAAPSAQAPSPLAEIGTCSSRATERLARPGGPRTPPAAVWAPGCDRFRAFRLENPVSRPPAPAAGFRAGFARVDITPAPGLGTLGWGPEAAVGQGYRNRLKARALVLQDAGGETVALVVVDLDAVSTILHREVARRVRDRTGGVIGADRLILSATHTHSAPGGFLSAWPLNLIGAPKGGFNRAFVDGLADRVAEMVGQAWDSLRDARAAWAVANVWGYTRNRILDAHRRNAVIDPFPIIPPGPDAPATLPDSARAINPRWVMLRVDLRDGSGGWRLGGTYSVFAVHGTVVPAGNDLYDADLHGTLTRALEDSLGGIHILANGTEGDASPDWRRASRCPPPRMGIHRRPAGPRTPPPLYDWPLPPPDDVTACLDTALADLERLRDGLRGEALRVYRSLDPEITRPAAADLRIRRNFETVHLTGAEGRRAGLCARPQAGMALAAGADDGRTRLKGWKVFGLIPLGIDWGSVTGNLAACQAPKRVFLAPIQQEPVGNLQFPEYTQFAVLRIGNLWLGTVPAEATTVAGLQMLAGLRRGIAGSRGTHPDAVRSDSLAILGLANGYLSYVATWDEYQAQTYEGGSTLFGPHEAMFMAGRLEGLARGMAAPNATPVDTILVRPGPLRAGGPDAGPHTPRPSVPAPPVCGAHRVTARWRDAPPDLFYPARGSLVAFDAGAGGAARDDDVRVEVRVVDRGGGSWTWEAAWRPPAPLPRGQPVTVRFPRWGEVRTCTVP